MPLLPFLASCPHPLTTAATQGTLLATCPGAAPPPLSPGAAAGAPTYGRACACRDVRRPTPRAGGGRRLCDGAQTGAFVGV